MPPWIKWIALLCLTIAAVLVPFFLWGETIDSWTRAFVESRAGWWTTAAVLGGLLALDIVLPIPSSLVSTAAGALLGFPGGLAISALGMTLACLAGYYLGLRTPAERALGQRDLDRAREFRDRYGDWALILSRPVPVLAEASVFLAGLVRSPLRRVLTITALANLGISAVYAATGAYATGKESFLLAFAGAIALPGLAMLVFRKRVR